MVLTHEASHLNHQSGSMLFEHWTLKQTANDNSIAALLDCVSGANSITRRLFGVVMEQDQKRCFEMPNSDDLTVVIRFFQELLIFPRELQEKSCSLACMRPPKLHHPRLV